MATIRFNQIADARGSVNGTVYSRGIGGLYMKNRVKPINPQTAKQLQSRSRLALLASSWRGLTDDERAAWSEMASNYPATNRVGESYTPSGYQLFMTLNSNLLATGTSQITAPLSPVAFGENALNDLTLELTAGSLTTGTLDTDNATGADELLIIEATGSLSTGVSSPSGSLFKQIMIGAAAGSSFNIAASYVAVFGEPLEDAKVFVRCFLVNSTTGQRQLLGKMSTVVTTL